MKNVSLMVAVLLASSLAGAGAAFALSSQAGNSMSGNFANIADPDEQLPPLLGGTGNRGSSSPSDNLDSGNEGQGFVNKDIVEQMKARGNGSYLPPDSDK
jgi:hypothetical protein